jgi:hypothetical protein
MKEFLPEYAAGTLPTARHAEVTRHLGGCADCRAELATWQAMADLAVELPGEDIVRRALLRGVLTPDLPAAARGVAARRRWGLPLALLRAQARLVPALLWVASTLAMAAGAAAAYRSTDGAAGSVLSLVAPMVVALGVVGVCAPDRDPALEVCAAAVTGPRFVLLARVTLVLGYNVALALAGSGVLWFLGLRADGLIGLVAAWLGPTVLLSSLALLAAVVVGAELAAAAATAAWLMRLVAGGSFGTAIGWLAPVRAVWTTNPGTVIAAIILLAVAALLAGRLEPDRPHRATDLT